VFTGRLPFGYLFSELLQAIGATPMTKIPFSLNRHVVTVFLMAMAGFYIAITLQGHVAELLKFGAKNSLIYFPAGIAFVVILVGGAWGAIGVFCALSLHYFLLNNEVIPLFIVLSFTAFSAAIQFFVIRLGLGVMGVTSCLGNLKHLHVLTLALVFSVAHSLCHHLNLLILLNQEHSWLHSFILISTFAGVSAVLLGLWLFAKLYSKLIGILD
jgi:hypothetical protein